MVENTLLVVRAWWMYLGWKKNDFDIRSYKSNHLHVGFGSILGGSIAIHVPEDASGASLSFSEFGGEVARPKSSVDELDMNKNQDTVCSKRKSMSHDGGWDLEGFRFIFIISGTQRQTCPFQRRVRERHLYFPLKG